MLMLLSIQFHLKKSTNSKWSDCVPQPASGTANMATSNSTWAQHCGPQVGTPEAFPQIPTQVARRSFWMREMQCLWSDCAPDSMGTFCERFPATKERPVRNTATAHTVCHSWERVGCWTPFSQSSSSTSVSSQMFTAETRVSVNNHLPQGMCMGCYTQGVKMHVDAGYSHTQMQAYTLGKLVWSFTVSVVKHMNISWRIVR